LTLGQGLVGDNALGPGASTQVLKTYGSFEQAVYVALQ
jgi:hypothetical protein